MLTFLKTEIQAEEFSLSVAAPNDDKSANRNHDGENLYTAAVLIAHDNFKRKCCEFCNLKNHVSSKCLKITEPASRKKILRQKGLCFSKEHLASSCKLHYICRKCNGKHHISICRFEPSKSGVTNPPSQEDSIEATASNFSSNKNTILLQTALATATNISEKLHSFIILQWESKNLHFHRFKRKIKTPSSKARKDFN